MARVTRSSARRTASSTSTSVTGTSNSSSISSAQASAAASETPATSDNEAGHKKPQGTRKRDTIRKRAASSDLDDIEPEELVSVKRPALKRRAVSSTCYVEIVTTSKEEKGEAKVCKSARESCARNAQSVYKASASMPPPCQTGKNKGKNKVPVASTPASSLDEDIDMESDASLEYKEIDESEGSGSEYVVSEEEDENAFVASDSDEEAVMLAAAAEMSLQTARSSGASGSGSSSKSTNKAAVLAFTAAERRMERANKGIDADDYLSEDDQEIDESGSESDVPLSSKGKGKAHVKKGKKSDLAPWPTLPKKHMTLAQLRAEKKEQRCRANEWKKEIKAEEKKLMRELGRRLTYVRMLVVPNKYCNSDWTLQAEKSSLALLRHHPELKDVWGDIEETIPVIKPTQAEQPDNLKLTLLPFQRESLFWMRQQEQSIWHGGMLAVRFCPFCPLPR